MLQPRPKIEDDPGDPTDPIPVAKSNSASLTVSLSKIERLPSHLGSVPMRESKSQH